MSKQLRVHILAKELGVESKDIIAKCKAEGIDLKNHMAVIKLGLAESIREWFSAGADVTTVEVADPVDLEKVKKPPRRKALVEDEAPMEDDATAVAIEEPPPDLVLEMPEPTEEEAVVVAEPLAPAALVELEAPVVEQEEQPSAEAAAETTEAPEDVPAIAEQPAHPVQPPTPAAPSAPPAVPVRPAGPQVVPKPAALQGPRVVRIEAPEPVRTPRPRPAIPDGPGPSPDREWSGIAARGRPPGVRGREDDKDVTHKTARSPRRHGRSADIVVERIKEYKDQDVIERRERLASVTGQGLRARRTAERRRMTTPGAPAAPVGRRETIEITTPILLKDFCDAVGAKFKVLSAKLLEHTGKLMRINDLIDNETAELLAMDLGVSLTIRKARTELEKLQDEFNARPREHLERRPPIVAMLGHVDHGKTSLLDAIRKTRVAAGEAGGITQHIGAYRIDRGDWHVTFLDTPGHEAFTAMRARGANMTDVVVLVVAATDGVMPQTVEAINHAKAAGVTIVVALNKIDVPNIDLNKIYGQLAEQELTPSEWGGTTDVIKTSATTGLGIDELIGHLSTLSDLMNLQADATIPAYGTVIEAEMAEGRGPVAQVLVREGLLKNGQFIACGAGAGRVRSLFDDQGKRLDKAGPATPVTVLGLDELPQAGDPLYVVSDLSRAKEVAKEIRDQRRQESLQQVRKPMTLEQLLQSGKAEEVPELNVILKADVQGSLESLRQMLGEFPANKARLRLLHSGVGTISEADVTLAHTSKAAVIGFNIVAEDRARQLAEQLGVQIRTYRVIYEIKDDLLRALEGLLAPEEQRQYRGRAEVRQVFNITRAGTVAGCAVVDGIIGRNHRVRLLRDGRIIVDDAGIGSLKRHKDDAREVRSGLECGIKIEGYDDIKPGDLIEAFEVVEVRQKL